MATAPFNHGTRIVDAGNEPRPLDVANGSVIGAVVHAPDADFAPDEPFAFYTHQTEVISKLGSSGNALDIVNAIKAQGIEAPCVFVRPDTTASSTTEEIRNKMVGSAASMSGVHALSYALGHTGVEPTVLVAPSYSAGQVDDAKNPLADAVEQVGTKLRAISVFDTGGNNAASSLRIRADFSSRYTYLIDPFVRVASATEVALKPASIYAAALILKRDKQKGGVYWSPSNQETLGILGTARPISYFDGEIDHEANQLNEAGIATFIPSRLVQGAGGQFASNGRTLWGNRTTSEDPLWQFINVVRTRAALEKTIMRGFRWANDDNLSDAHVMAVMRSGQALLDEMTAIGAILGGRMWWERDLNSNASMRSGKIRIEFDAEEAPPLEDLIFGSRRNEAYFDSLAENIQRRMNVSFSTSIGDMMAG